MDLARKALDVFLHLDRHLNTLGGDLGVFTSETSRLLNKKHLMRAQRFYERYGGKAIILAISVFLLMPIGIEYLRARREARRSGPAAAAACETPVE